MENELRINDLLENSDKYRYRVLEVFNDLVFVSPVKSTNIITFSRERVEKYFKIIQPGQDIKDIIPNAV